MVMGVQASIVGAIGLAGRAARRLWALNSKGRQPYIATSLLYYGPYRVPFQARPDEPLAAPSSQALLLAALCAISAKLGSWTFYALLSTARPHCSGVEEVKQKEPMRRSSI